MPDAQIAHPLPDDVRRFLEAHRFAVVATVNPDGSPQQALVWYLLEADEANGSHRVVINSAEGRRWPSNLRRDPRISFAVEDGLDWVGLRGIVTVQDDQPTAQHDIATMARLNDPPEVAERTIHNQFERQQRVSFRFRATTIHAEITATDHAAEG